MSYANNAATSEMFFEVKAFTTICKSYHNDLPFILNSTQPISLCSTASIPKFLLTLSKPFIPLSPFFSIKLNQTKYIYILFFFYLSLQDPLFLSMYRCSISKQKFPICIIRFLRFNTQRQTKGGHKHHFFLKKIIFISLLLSFLRSLLYRF